MEQKAWANSQTAKIQQAHFITLAHNLMVLLNHQLETEEGIVDQKSQRQRKQTRAREIKQAQAKGEKVNSLVLSWRRATQRCFQFIRWLRHCLENSTPWREAVDMLRPLMQNYLH